MGVTLWRFFACRTLWHFNGHLWQGVKSWLGGNASGSERRGGELQLGLLTKHIKIIEADNGH